MITQKKLSAKPGLVGCLMSACLIVSFFLPRIWNNNPKVIGEQERFLRLEWNPNKTEIPTVMKEFLQRTCRTVLLKYSVALM